ncbi:nicotianamine synthase-like protein [Natranaerovirga hydrolytica]|uniref:Nicotianamine synthase-like protein n=1 Tax=Natranaerovirga hydrolytica TaxID=680378 RepID=A0A4R1MTG3_9FIRM|nr:nicotianamine synthase family protein [Natranaerovirga hydrolytica]TCK93253.1 nicotianamine synthase-like protein [Natranaerovirga hydrolytica]
MNIIGYYTKKLEKIVSSNAISLALMEKYYEKEVNREINIGEITKKDRVLCIGGGPVPCTAMVIAKKTQAKVVVVDNDEASVVQARTLIQKLNLGHKIEVIEADGENVYPNTFSVIHIARQVCPKEKVISFMLNNVSKGTRILVRTPKKGLSLLYDKNSCCKACHKENKKEVNLKGTLLLVR